MWDSVYLFVADPFHGTSFLIAFFTVDIKKLNIHKNTTLFSSFHCPFFHSKTLKAFPG